MPECRCIVLYQAKKFWQCARASSMLPKRAGKSGRYFIVLNCASEYGLSSETWGRLWLLATPRSTSSRVSDDNAYAESLFRTAKYRPEFPAQGFASLDEARAWAAEFVRWYNVDHRHSGIRYVSPQQRHTGADQAILAARHALYARARQRNPARWSRRTRDWSYIGVVTLNPERDIVVNIAADAQHTQQKAA